MLATGSRVYYPLNPLYRSFVNMHAIRDPRFKGTDASNLHDEELDEDEQEWSDDEKEAEAKRRKKLNKGKGRQRSGSVMSTASSVRGGGAGGVSARPGFHGLPAKPHLDCQYVRRGRR
jgi:H/ACA ribonucleoprotein complex non-core subunit NAF1